MGLYSVVVATLMYVIAAIDLFRQGNYSMAGVWGCYAAANCFLTWASFRPGILAIIRQML